MKIAITGKGGVGKSTLSAALALLLTDSGNKVLAIDADPDANLAGALGVPPEIQDAIVPVSKQTELIEERTGAKVNQYGQMFKLNPEVSDIADTYATVHNGIPLLVLGAIRRGGGGCACPENVLLRALVRDLILHKDETLILDMEAGIEHLGRATASGVDIMLVVVEPGQMSIDCAQRILELSEEIGISRVYVVGNKVRDQEDKEFIVNSLPGAQLLGFVSYRDEFRKADRPGISVVEALTDDSIAQFKQILSDIGKVVIPE
ncbi:MAG: AAA family ATPase [Spirochaetales bacterium]|nr:AAA family ATPase [Spirochaetales bacterium]